MLKCDAPFPFAGCKAFLAGSADPVTVLRRNDNGSALVRMDPRPREALSRDASGNRTVDAADLCKSEKDAFEAALPKKRKKVRVGA